MTAWLISESRGNAKQVSGWRTWFDERAFQWGLRLAVLAPFVTFLGGLAIMSVRDLHPEYGLSWAVLHIVAFGAIQWVWLAPAAALFAVLGRRRFAAGLLVGGVVIGLANAIAWLIGSWIGAA
jgi:hypothetical protein